MRTHRLPHASSHEDTSWATTFGQPQVVAQPPQQPESHSLRAHRGSFTPRVVRGKHVSLELFALLGIFAHHENFLGGLPSGRVTADGTLFPLQSAIPSHIHDRNVSYHISIMCFRTEVGNGRGEDHHTDFSGERSGPSSPVRPVKTPLQSVARLLGRGISLAGAQLGGKSRFPSPQLLQNTLNVNAYVNAEMLARKSRANPSNSSNFELHDERADDPRHEDSF